MTLLLAFGPDRLNASGPILATRVIAPIDGSLQRAKRHRVRPAASLVGRDGANGTIVRFDPSQLAAGGQPVPAVTITGIGHPAASHSTPTVRCGCPTIS